MSTAAPNVDVTRAVNMLAGENVRLLDVREDDEWGRPDMLRPLNTCN